IMLIVYGVGFILVESRNKKPNINSFKELSYKTAIIIGLFQVLALIPGTSRSGATILGAILIGTSRYVAAEFSFFLAVPTMLGASALKLVKAGFAFTGFEWTVLATGCIVAFVVSIIAIKFLMDYIKKHDFKFFGYYRIILGILVLMYFYIIL
ncbi:MAG: undecaprenyl-diphosphate phosphatase, partial [Peptostreptococcaceae bacterium]